VYTQPLSLPTVAPPAGTAPLDPCDGATSPLGATSSRTDHALEGLGPSFVLTQQQQHQAVASSQLQPSLSCLDELLVRQMQGVEMAVLLGRPGNLQV